MDQVSHREAEPADRYREDLEANLRMVEALAPIHCTDCGGYHLLRARRRLRPGSPAALDRPEIVALLRDCLTHRPLTAAFDVLVAGAGDTSLLATCAAAASAGNAGNRSVRYTIIDHCQTPLALCAAFARQHRLEVQTRRMAMDAPDAALEADAIVVHSLLRFLPLTRHLATMRTLRGWLRPGGKVIFSHRLMAGGAKEDQPFYRSEYPTANSVLTLLLAAGFRVVSMQERIEEPSDAIGREPRRRMLALLRPEGS